MELRPTTPKDLDDIARLMCAAFGINADAPAVARALLTWKYLEAAKLWRRPCSYVLVHNESIAAHCAFVPLEFNREDELTGVCFMDWVGGRASPGAGVLLLRELMTQADASIVAGGSDAARTVVTKLGFTIRDSIDVYAQIIRPMRQARTRPRTKLWKDSARLLRNTAWSFAAKQTTAEGWNARRVEQFSGVAYQSAPAHTTPEHNAECLNYWLRCPALPMTGFEILKAGERRGHFLLACVGGQTRVADLRVDSQTVDEWAAAYRLASQTAAANDETCEVICIASTPFARQALDAAGFRQRGGAPLFVHEREKRFAGVLPMQWSFIDDDTAYLRDAAHPFAT